MDTRIGPDKNTEGTIHVFVSVFTLNLLYIKSQSFYPLDDFSVMHFFFLFHLCTLFSKLLFLDISKTEMKVHSFFIFCNSSDWTHSAAVG